MDDEVVVVSSKKELINFGYLSTNINKEIIYNGVTFLLKECGIRHTYRLPYMGYPNPNPIIIAKNPAWNIVLDGAILTITNII